MSPPQPFPQPTRSPTPIEGEEEKDISAAMGFASFGAKPNPPKKKRKIAGVESNGGGSGSNNTPLGVRLRGLGEGGERGLVGEVGEREGDGVGGVVVMGEGSEEGKRGLIGGLEVKRMALDVRSVGGGRSTVTDGLASSVGDHTGPNTTRIPTDHKDGKCTSEAGVNGKVGIENQREAVAFSGDNPNILTGPEAGRRADGQWDWQALRKGVRSQRGDTAFYDASFVEDPWRTLRA